jgi:2,5-diketo-D-gluconate reductase A
MKIPLIGLGTYQLKDDDCYQTVMNAIKIGYRHIDTAQRYFNEEQVGKAIKDSNIERKELFITTKLWYTNYSNAEEEFYNSLKKLQLDYVDLLLLHTPGFPKEYNNDVDHSKNKELRIIAWKSLEKLYKEGKVKYIGVSNYFENHLKELLEIAEIKPYVNQIEYHIWNQMDEIINFCKENNIIIVSWGTLGK